MTVVEEGSYETGTGLVQGREEGQTFPLQGSVRTRTKEERIYIKDRYDRITSEDVRTLWSPIRNHSKRTT